MRFEKEKEKDLLDRTKNISYKEVSNNDIDRFMVKYFKKYKWLNNKLKEN